MAQVTEAVKVRLEDLESYRLAPVDRKAAERSREAKRRQKERGIRFPDSTEIVRSERGSH